MHFCFKFARETTNFIDLQICAFIELAKFFYQSNFGHFLSKNFIKSPNYFFLLLKPLLEEVYLVLKKFYCFIHEILLSFYILELWQLQN